MRKASARRTFGRITNPSPSSASPMIWRCCKFAHNTQNRDFSTCPKHRCITSFAFDGSMRLGLLGNAAFLGVLGIGIRALIRSGRIADWVASRWPARAEAIGRFHVTSKTGHLVPWAPSGAMVVGVGLQVVEITVLAWAIGIPPRIVGSVAALGIHLLTASVAVLVPGQLGAREAAFSYSAEALGTSPTRAAAIALFWHLAQLVVSALGFAILALGPPRKPEAEPERERE